MSEKIDAVKNGESFIYYKHGNIWMYFRKRYLMTNSKDFKENGIAATNRIKVSTGELNLNIEGLGAKIVIVKIYD